MFVCLLALVTKDFWWLSGPLLALAVHLKTYPAPWALTIWLYLAGKQNRWVMIHKLWVIHRKLWFKNFNRSKTALEFGWNMLWNRFIYFIFNFYLFILLLLRRRISRTCSSSPFNSSRYPPQLFRKFNHTYTRVKGRLLSSKNLLSSRNHNILSKPF